MTSSTKTKAKPTPKKPIKSTGKSTEPVAKPAVYKAAQPAKVGVGILRKKELIDTVVKRSGVKKKDAKPVIEAMLAELGEMLADGREMALPPLGRVKINRQKPVANGRVIVLKLRQRDRLKADLTKVAAAE